MAMNQEIKAKWVAALRSGEYGQTTDKLCNGEGGFCCLGVLSDLHMKETGDGKWAKDSWGDFGYVADEVHKEDVPPQAVIDWSDLPMDNPMVKVFAENGGDYTYESVAELNDSGYTFSQIADLIEAQL